MIICYAQFIFKGLMMKIFSKILAVLALSSFCFAINLEPLENACKTGNENACKAVGAIKGKIADFVVFVNYDP